ncbi:MAG: hypothetical protein AAF192_03910 [Pseudomonadota bacterium]
MTDMWTCLQAGMDAGDIDRERGRAAQTEYAELVERFQSRMPEAAVKAEAARILKDRTVVQAKERRHAKIAQLQRMVANHQLIHASDDPAKAIRSVLDFNETADTDVIGVRAQRDGLRRQFMAGIADLLKASSLDLVGNVRNKPLLRDVVRELHGEATGDARAKEIAGAVRTQQERARRLFNAHGGSIGKLDDYGVRHTHDARKIGRTSRDAWIEAVTPELDWARIEDLKTGQPFAAAGQAPDPAAARRFLGEIYDNITTDGWSKRTPSLTTQGKALYNRNAEHRVLHFRSSDAWWRYNERFGQSNPFNTIVSHFDRMARDIALMRVLGPNPTGGLEHLIQTAERRATLSGDTKMKENVSIAAAGARAMMGHLTGAANRPVDGAVASFLAGTRAVLTSAQLGSAALSSVTDLWTLQMAGQAVGMGAGAPIKRAMELTASQSSREAAARMGYVADTLADTMSASARFLGDTWTPEMVQRLPSFIMRASGLSWWTDTARNAFQMEFSGLLAENAGRALSEVEQPLQRLLIDRGISAEEWAQLSDPELLFRAPKGETFLAPSYWREVALARGDLPAAQIESLSIKLSGIIEEQLEFAVPSVSLEGRSRLIGDAQPGTFYGELLRSTAMYKNFTLSFTLNQYRRIAALRTPQSRLAYGMQMTAGLTLLGALAVQLKEVSKGRDPRPMTDATFWGAAFLQGGGVGIFGDFFASETSRAGGGLAETLAGPVVGVGGDIIRAGASNVARMADGKDPLIGRDIANLARRYTPGTSLWQLRLTTDRLLWDELQRLLDPEAEQGFRRIERNHRRQRGGRYWWAPGDRAPERGPELANALEDRP